MSFLAACLFLGAVMPAPPVLFNGWGLTPAGETQIPVSNLVLKLAVSPDGRALVGVSGGFSHTGVSVIDLASRRVVQFVPLEHCWNGLAFSRDGRRVFVSGAGSGVMHVFRYQDEHLTAEPDVAPKTDAAGAFLSGLAVHPATGAIYVCDEAHRAVWVLDATTLQLKTSIPVGDYPHSCIFGGDHTHLYVSDWGASAVSIVDARTNRWARDLGVGLRPNDMALAADGRLFVACSGDNTVHVIQTSRLEHPSLPANPDRLLPTAAREIISTSLYPDSPEGSTPDAVAVSPDGRTLFVANADNNDVAVVDISPRRDADADEAAEAVSVVDGFIPVGWYPSALAVSPDNGTLFVANGKGLGSRPNFPAQVPHPTVLFAPPPFDYIGNVLDGSVACISRPTSAQMAAFTAQVRKNSPYVPERLHRAVVPADSIIPASAAGTCPIRYVLYIIRENRTYDQVLGDLRDGAGHPLGNGDPRLTMFGEKVTPNEHDFARSFVLFDHLYCNGEVSVDGHSWCDAAIATDFNERSWISSYSNHGTIPGNAQMMTPASGYLWDLCRRGGVTYRTYGEGASDVPSQNRAKWGRAFAVRDYDRAESWIADLHRAEKSGDMARFAIMSLGEDHTQGTRPGAHTPDACVASNDLALGRIVEAASHSRFWSQMAIFMIEDDAQNGPDHVDAHRTVGFVVSPYSRRSFVDSTPYTTASMVRTIELILGLPPMTQYDAGATPMYAAFSREADLTPYTALRPTVDLAAMNTAHSPMAWESSHLDLDDYDQAPEDELNRILWAYAKPGVPYATPIHRAIFLRE